MAAAEPRTLEPWELECRECGERREFPTRNELAVYIREHTTLHANRDAVRASFVLTYWGFLGELPKT